MIFNPTIELDKKRAIESEWVKENGKPIEYLRIDIVEKLISKITR